MHHIQNELLNSVNYNNYNNDKLTINIELNDDEYNNLFGSNNLKEKYQDYFRHICSKAGITVNMYYRKANTRFVNNAFKMHISVVNPHKNQENVKKKIK